MATAAWSSANQPFRRMFAMRAEWLADRPEFDRVLERMREADRLPEVRDFPAWKAERRAWFMQTGTMPNGGASEEIWHLRGGTHLRVVAQPLPDGGLLLIFEDRTEHVQLASARDTLLRVRTATFDNLFEALGVFAADGRLQLWNNRFRVLWGLEEEFLAGHPRVDVFADAAAGKLMTPNRSALILDLVRSATAGRQQRGARRLCRRPAFRIRGRPAARRQRAVHDARHHRQPACGAGLARTRERARGGGQGEDGVRREHEL
ncbi:PAS-domain containing protein [Sphingomonas aerolata]|uniref:PAS-domain containing protein n=1 Tax=Sphingomonas aerolata TaxID=185951 RepID=UPI003A5BAD9C